MSIGFVVLIGFVFGVLFGEGSSSDDIETSVVNGLSLVEKSYSRIEVSGTESSIDVRTKEVRNSVFVRYLSSGADSKLELLDSVGSVLRVSVATPSLSFSAKRETPVDDFMFLELADGQDGYESVRDEIATNASSHLSAYRLSGTSLLGLLGKLESRQWARGSLNQRSVVVMNGTTRPWEAKDGMHYNLVKLTFDGDSKVILIEEFTVVNVATKKEIASSRIVREYRSLDKKIPILKKLVSFSFDENKEIDAKSEFIVSKFDLGAVGMNEFTLKGNRIDRDVDIEEHNSDFWMMFVAALAMIILSLVGIAMFRFGVGRRQEMTGQQANSVK